MDWKEILKDFSFFKFQADIKDIIKGQQVGIVNKIENIYNINMPQEMAEKIIDLKITEAMERATKEEAFVKLNPIGSALDILPESMTASVVTSAMATTALKISAREFVVTGSDLDLKVDRKKEE